MVATMAFGAGNDYPGVWVVILANTPFNIASIVQQFSRAVSYDGKYPLNNIISLYFILLLIFCS